MLRMMKNKGLQVVVRLTLAVLMLATSSHVLAQDSARDRLVAESQQDSLCIKRHPQAVRRKDCFPIESLPSELQVRSKELLLNAFDSEALYTLVGDLKPVSEGFFDTWFQVQPPNVDEVERVRQAMSAWQCGEHYEVGVLVFQRLREGERFASGWVASKPALKKKMAEEKEFFEGLGLPRIASAEATLLRIEGAKLTTERWRGFGTIFGYPSPAIDFFVKAGNHYATTGEFVERDFRNFPTHNRSTGGFVYAVPKLAAESAEEAALRRQVDAILTTYRSYRDHYITDDNPDRMMDLVRDWFDDGEGWCHPNHALQKANISN